MLTKVWAEMDVQLSNYVRGKVLEIFIVGVAAAILVIYVGTIMVLSRKHMLNMADLFKSLGVLWQ